MSDPTSLGAIAEIWRFPVKSMAGEQVASASLTTAGLAGDRAYGLIDLETGRVASAKSVRRFDLLLDCQARFVASPTPDAPAPPISITMPDGRAVRSDEAGLDRALSDLFDREVRLARTAPDDFTIDQYHPDVAGADPAGHRDVTVQQKLGAAYFAAVGMASPVPAGAFFDLFPLSVMTTSTLRRLQELRPQSAIAPARFRMNLILETPEDGFVENAWLGRALAIGASASVAVAMPDPRCVMVTLPQAGLPRDTGLLAALVEHNPLSIAGSPPFPCAGVYAVVTAAGELKVGDPVRLG